MNRRNKLLSARGWILGLLLVCVGKVWAGAPVTVEINQFQFFPREITVDAGTVVQWMNRDQTVHNIIAPDAKLASPGMDTGDHFDFTFAKPGDYPYLCGLHPHMTGIIHVRTPGKAG
jgi:plastocyanin